METFAKLTIKTKLKLSLIAILTFVVLSLALSTVANPASLFYPIRRLEEKIFLKFKPDPSSKIEYTAFLLDHRLSDLVSLVNSKDHEFILSSSLRYSTTAGDLTNLILNNNFTDKIDSVKAKFKDHQEILQNLLNIYPDKDIDTEWKYIQDDINYLSLYSDQLSKK